MKQIRTALSKQPSLVGFDFFVTRYDAKPVLVQKKGTKIIRRLGYMESIQKFGHMVKDEQLKVARKIGANNLRTVFSLILVFEREEEKKGGRDYCYAMGSKR